MVVSVGEEPGEQVKASEEGEATFSSILGVLWNHLDDHRHEDQ